MTHAQRYCTLTRIGTGLNDELPSDANWHKRFNWRANVRRDLSRGGCSRANLIEWHRIFTEQLMKGKTNA